MYKTFFLKYLFIAFAIFAIVSCDNDSNEIGADIIGNDNFEVGVPEFFTINAANQPIGVVETSDLPVNTLGIYNNPVFGVTKAHIAVQLQLASLDPEIDATLLPVIDSVIFKVPYFVSNKTSISGGASTYDLDSIYGSSATSKIKLRIYESKYYMNELDGSQQIQKYYSNQNVDFDGVKGAWLNNSSDTKQNDAFSFDKSEFVEIIKKKNSNVDSIVTRVPPGIRFKLDNDFFKTKIIEAPEGKLLNNNTFKEYFRGLYFNVDYSGAAPPVMSMINIKGGRITIYYKEDKKTTTTVNGVPVTTTTRVSKSLLLNPNGKSVNLYESTPVATPNSDRLYVKGGEGSLAVLDLFGPDTDGDGVADELKALRDKKWLVNDASITFQIDNNAMGIDAAEPQRIFLYDLNNRRPLIDYYTDLNSPSSNPKNGKSVFGGIIKKSNGRGTEYKIRMTNYIRALLLKDADSTNVRLGVVVTESISDVSNKSLKTPVTNPVIKEMPRASVMNPLGTILFGPNIPIGDTNYDKRLKFKIYFTKPKQN